jgi:hypothetical protein
MGLLPIISKRDRRIIPNFSSNLPSLEISKAPVAFWNIPIIETCLKNSNALLTIEEKGGLLYELVKKSRTKSYKLSNDSISER